MNANPQSNRPRRRWWPWVLGICLTPFVLLGVIALSVLTLDRDAAVLRQHIMAGNKADWQTKIQLSVGRFSLGLVRTGLTFVHRKEVVEAQMALRAVKAASVGVYERKPLSMEAGATDQFILSTDRAMVSRGWNRLVGVVDKEDRVLVYVPSHYDADGPIDICLAVINRKEMVVVSATVDPTGLAELVEKHAGEDLKRSLKLAQF